MWVSLSTVSARNWVLFCCGEGSLSASLMLAAWSHQTRAAGDRKREIFSRNSEGTLGSFCE